MRLYNMRKIIRFLTLHVCFPALVGLFDIYSFPHLSKFQLAFAGSSHTCAKWVGCLSPTPRACVAVLRSWQPGRLYSRHAVGLAPGLQQKRHSQPDSLPESPMNALYPRPHIGTCFEGYRGHFMHTHLVGREDMHFLTFPCLVRHAPRDESRAKGMSKAMLPKSWGRRACPLLAQGLVDLTCV